VAKSGKAWLDQECLDLELVLRKHLHGKWVDLPVLQWWAKKKLQLFDKIS
jgi:hypothetical protein